MKLRVNVDGTTYDVDVDLLEVQDHGASLTPTPPPASVSPLSAGPAAAPAQALPAAPVAEGNTLNSTIPGTVLEILATPGQQIKQGEPVVVLDAMKMNTQVPATHDGTVKEILVSSGDAVKMGQPLLSFE